MEHMIITPPVTEKELMTRANAMAGYSIGDVATYLGIHVPENRINAKGFIGQLLEKYLGADASSRPEPDFTQLGIELKTLPISFAGKPLESTYICTAPMSSLRQQSWETSTVYLKLRRVLWIPIARDKNTHWRDVKIATPLLWSPTLEELSVLKNDWEELSEKICCGEWHTITAAWGTYLQLRPKAANSRVLTKDSTLMLPQGFYLRAGFTENLLRQYYEI